MFVLVKCHHPESYDAADAAVIEVTENLILMLDKRIAQATAMHETDFCGTKWRDYTPIFLSVAGPESVGSDMTEEDFEATLDSNLAVRLADDFDESQHETARMSPITLTISASCGDAGPHGSFYWQGTDQYIGASGRVETYELHEDTLDEWAELIGCTEILAKVRQCRGVEV